MTDTIQEKTDQTEVDILSRKCDKALLISIQFPDMKKDEAADHLVELESLVETMGIPVVHKIVVKLRKINKRFLIGKGKIEEIIDIAGKHDADILIFDDDLSPSQQRNIEELANITVIDRHEVILDIFADRAQTREAVLQVALARLNYSLPRLTRAWTHLSRQRGGARGTKGEGETQLEVDRRLALKKITRIKSELQKVRIHRATQRKKRKKIPLPTAAIIGYTNAGKSSLLNCLTSSDTLVEDKLFATLDPTTKKLVLNNGQELLFTDTVGFIRKLPHDLVDAFKSTLEETELSDILIHVLDISNPEVRQHYETTRQVLQELNCEDKPVLLVFNKTDMIEKHAPIVLKIKRDFPNAVFMSIYKGEGIENLTLALTDLLADKVQLVSFIFPNNRYDLVASVHREGKVLFEKHTGENIQIDCQVSPRMKKNLQAFIV